MHDGWREFTCNHCKLGFRSLIATIRAKNSRGSWRALSRDFGVRVRHGGGTEEYIQFPQKGYDDFELRSGDLAVFSYVGKHMILVQNLTIGQHRVATTTWADEIYHLTLIVGAVGAIAIWYWIKHGTPVWQQWMK